MRSTHCTALQVLLAPLLSSAALAQPQAPQACVWDPGTSAPETRFESGNIVVDGRIMVFGGFFAPFPGVTPRVDVYEPATDTWSQRGDMPTLLTHAAPVLDDRTAWFVGGFVGNHPGPATAVVWNYDVDLDTWTNGPSLPVATAGGGLVILGRELHYVGGVLADRDTTVGDHWVLDLDSPGAGWWSEPPMPTPRDHLSAVELGGLLYAIGGQLRHDTNPVDRFEVEVYDPVSDTWSSRAPLPFSRSHAEPGTFTTADGRIIVTGGKSSSLGLGMIPDVHAYHPLSDSWTVLPSLPRPLLAPVAKVVDGNMVVIGGGTAGFVAQADTIIHPESTSIPTEYRINVGGNHWTSPSSGHTWCNDHGADGSLFTNPAVTQIAGTDDDHIYLTERYSNSPAIDTLTLRYPLNPGSYRVRLHFAELYWGAPGGAAAGPGKRVFDVFIEDELKLDDYDTWLEVGTAAADVRSFDVRVQDLSLDLILIASANRAKLNAIEILTLPDPSWGSYCVAEPNSTGSPALMSFIGTVSMAEENLELIATPIPNQPGVFFYGPNQVQVPFGNGFRCVGGGIFRLPLHFATENTLRHTIDYDVPPSASGQITAGSTWNFQAWYRDPLGGGAAFDTSDGLSIVFTP